MGISDWPESERPRERLLNHGASHLSDAELLAIFLRTGVSGISAVELARELLGHFGGLRELILADKESFCQYRGLGVAKYVQLQACIELVRRYMKERLVRDHQITNPELARDFFRAALRDRQEEVFVCTYLDTANRVIQFEEVFCGTIDRASIYPRELVKRILHHNASAVIVGHNHPSGLAEPSEDDIAITQILVKALDLIDVRLLDHLVVGDHQVVSFAERGLL